MPKPTHSSFARLLDYATRASSEAHEPITDEAGLRMRLGVTSGTFTNWKSRGISQEGALTAQRKLGCSATWVLTGVGDEGAPVSTSSTAPDATDIPAFLRRSNVEATPDLAQAPPTVAGTLERLGELLSQATPATRDAVAQLLLRYAQAPDQGKRIAQAIELLLQEGGTDDPAAG